jgi:hypothetical protein
LLNSGCWLSHPNYQKGSSSIKIGKLKKWVPYNSCRSALKGRHIHVKGEALRNKFLKEMQGNFDYYFKCLADDSLK